jgi:asparagine synthase (glutamine-hydrolysing)
MYRHIITQRTPRLARIPSDKNEFIPTANPLEHRIHTLSVKARRRLKLFPNHPTLYADYENYLRRSLRPWAESILCSPQVAAHGVFNPDYVQALTERHMGGQELWTIGKVAPIITMEMVLENLFA